MTFSQVLSTVDSQTLALPRRELLEKFYAIAVAAVSAKRLPRGSTPETYPSPDFNIGDLVAGDWLDEFDNEATDFGEVVGLCYLPERQSAYHPAKSWVYYIYWTHTTCESANDCYPDYDGQPVRASELRLIKHA